jgi:hypothetical protein
METVKAKEPFDVSTFGAKNKTCVLRFQFEKQTFFFCWMFWYPLDVHFMPHISAADKAAKEAWGGAAGAEEAWETGGGADDGGGKVSGGDVWNS